MAAEHLLWLQNKSKLHHCCNMSKRKPLIFGGPKCRTCGFTKSDNNTTTKNCTKFKKACIR